MKVLETLGQQGRFQNHFLTFMRYSEVIWLVNLKTALMFLRNLRNLQLRMISDSLL